MTTTIRFKFERDERLRFLSHLDLQRLFQRAFRRAEIPTAYSNGFNPHIRLAFAGALPLGLITDEEYGDIVLAHDMTAKDFLQRMNAVLPGGLKLLDAKEIQPGTLSLAAALKRADYRLTLFDQPVHLTVAVLQKATEDFLSRPVIEIEKRNKKKKWVKTDIRPYIANLSFIGREGADLDFELSVNYIDQKCVKALQVMQALSDFAGLGLRVDETLRLHKTAAVMENEW